MKDDKTDWWCGTYIILEFFPQVHWQSERERARKRERDRQTEACLLVQKYLRLAYWYKSTWGLLTGTKVLGGKRGGSYILFEFFRKFRRTLVTWCFASQSQKFVSYKCPREAADNSSMRFSDMDPCPNQWTILLLTEMVHYSRLLSFDVHPQLRLHTLVAEGLIRW
jgi:hypothetical protein